MTRYTLQALKNRITDRIHDNRSRAISGVELQEILHDVVDSLAGITSGDDPIITETPFTDYGLSGSLDGTNRFFATSRIYLPGSTHLCLNGVRQFRGEDYTEEGSGVICFTTAPHPGDRIIADYRY